VSRLIVPTKTTMARRTTVSLRDIECLRGMGTTPEVLYLQIHECQAARHTSLCQIRIQYKAGSFRSRFASRRLTLHRYAESLATAPLYEQQYGGTNQLSTEGSRVRKNSLFQSQNLP